MPETLDRRLQIVMGKGGVGRSAITAALARRACEAGLRVLVVQINTKDKLCDYLGQPASSDALCELLPGLFIVNIQPESALREYVLLQVKLELVYRLVFKNRAVSTFLKAVPALNDLLAMGKIQYHMDERLPNGQPRFDRIFVDAPATGHGLFFLGLPLRMAEAIGSGPIHRESKRMHEMLSDPRQTAVHLVAIPEEMPVCETQELYAGLSEELRLPLGGLFINKIPPCVFMPNDIARLDSFLQGREASADPFYRTLGALRGMALRCARMRAQMDLLQASIPLPRLYFPLLYSLEFGPAQITQLIEPIKRFVAEGPHER